MYPSPPKYTFFKCFSFPIRLLLSIVLISVTLSSYGSGVKGTIQDETGKPMPYATIFVKQTGTGTTTNENGYYEITLDSGRYELVFQFLGYESQVRVVDLLKTSIIELNISLKPQATVLPTFVVQDNNEDPAYTIMRKAIAKAKYHTQQLDTYSARVYVKGTGKLKDYPWLAKRALEKEGIKKNRVFISESVSEIKYTRPKKFEEKVISIRSDGKDNNTSPTPYIFGSFYESEIAGTVSPLSPRAFSYYKFEYLGTFTDRNYEVSKIKVTPRAKGDNVVDGIINIVEDWWSIHSMDIHTTKLGIDFFITAMYAPIEDKAWLPVSHQFKIDGKVFGFEFEYKYLATVSDYKIKLNEALFVEHDKMEVIDEKIQKEEAKKIEKKNASTSKSKTTDANQLGERLASGKEITRKELKTIMKEYEKEERQQEKEPEVISDMSFKVDSGAYKKDSVYWTTIRPVPLTTEEVVGYHKTDSLAKVERRNEAGDTLKPSKHKGFQLWDLLIGDSYPISEHSNFKIHFPMPGFNTVEGWNFVYKVSFGTILQDTNKTRFTITPAFRYAFSREVASGNLEFLLRNKKYRLEIEGGRYVKQYNPDEPILPIINDFTTLLQEKNLMKLYERRYIDILYRRKFSDYISATGTLSWARRHELENTTDYKWVDRSHIEDYTPNRPVNAELEDTAFPDHEAFVASLNITTRPWLKYRIRNGEKIEVDYSSPVLSFDYRKGISGAFGSDVDFDQIEAGIKHTFRIGVRGRMHIGLRGGMFLNDNDMYFMDYKHFLGNLTPFMTTDPAGSYRLLDYYAFSTADKYFAGNAYYEFRRFLVTSLPFVRVMGIRENIFVNYLATPYSQNYTELGYAIDGIFRIFRLEFATNFVDGNYQTYGFRIGIATSIAIGFSDN
ncbi:MAG TPA: DUF5686 and carboxypeptidase regulatory-like domain-containing protein [Ohtaekwangia sp.]